MDLRIVGHIPRLTSGQRPADGFPRPVGLQVHAPEGQVLHYLPGHHRGPGQTAAEGEGVVQARAGGELGEGVDVPLSLRLGRGRGFVVV